MKVWSRNFLCLETDLGMNDLRVQQVLSDKRWYRVQFIKSRSLRIIITFCKKFVNRQRIDLIFICDSYKLKVKEEYNFAVDNEPLKLLWFRLVDRFHLFQKTCCKFWGSELARNASYAWFSNPCRCSNNYSSVFHSFQHLSKLPTWLWHICDLNHMNTC